MTLRDYQTGFATTLTVYLGVCGLFAFSAFTTFHDHRHMGWLEMLTCIGIAHNFHRLFHKDSEMS